MWFGHSFEKHRPNYRSVFCGLPWRPFPMICFWFHQWAVDSALPISAFEKAFAYPGHIHLLYTPDERRISWVVEKHCRALDHWFSTRRASQGARVGVRKAATAPTHPAQDSYPQPRIPQHGMWATRRVRTRPLHPAILQREFGEFAPLLRVLTGVMGPEVEDLECHSYACTHCSIVSKLGRPRKITCACKTISPEETKSWPTIQIQQPLADICMLHVT